MVASPVTHRNMPGVPLLLCLSCLSLGCKGANMFVRLHAKTIKQKPVGGQTVEVGHEGLEQGAEHAAAVIGFNRRLQALLVRVLRPSNRTRHESGC